MTSRFALIASGSAGRRLAAQAARAQALEAGGLYAPAFEHDACGVGMIATTGGTPRREVVTLAINALKAVWHRGAVDADGKSGDGAGLRLDVPLDFFNAQVERTGHVPTGAPVGVGMVFLPRIDFAAQEAARAIVETEILRAGLILFGWRQVPVRPQVLGARADAARPEIEQVLFADRQDRDPARLERELFLVRRRIEKRAEAAGVPGFYICSFSTQSLVYKGMFLAEQIDEFYPDLTNETFVSRSAVFHQRYSTNTFPEWRLAQPFRMLAHNGEINTLKGNVNWMTSHEIGLAADLFGDRGGEVRPIIQRGSSDSMALDQAFEALARTGRALPLVKSMLIPEAWSKREGAMPEARRSLYAYANAVIEPWDGPAALAMCDGRWAIAGLDRNGLRPLRWATTKDGLLVVGSEAGMVGLDDARITRRGAIAPGGMIGVDLDAGALYLDDALMDKVAGDAPYQDWAATVEDVEERVGLGEEDALYSRPEDLTYGPDERVRRQRAAGLTREDLEAVIKPMIEDGKEAIGSMGDDAPLAVLSRHYRPLSHYFRQNFSQVTNPPIDPLREGRVMSLRTRFRNLGAMRGRDGALPHIFMLDSPILTNGMMRRLGVVFDEGAVDVDCTFEPLTGSAPGEALRTALDRIRADVVAAVRDGAKHVILTDARQSPRRAAVPMILATAGAHRALLTSAERAKCAITVRTAEAHDAHYCAVLIGVGATCVNPYLAFDAAADRVERGLHPGLTLEKAALNIKRSLDAGLLKIMSKMGISIVSSYRGGCNFETLGLSRALCAEYFPGMPSRISGIGLAGLEETIASLHASAWSGVASLQAGGFFKQRANGETHALEARVVSALQTAVRNNDPDAYAAYVEALGEHPPVQLRDLLELRPLGAPTPEHEVESANAIQKRMVTPGMSLGALSPEAHGVLNVAMNRLGARSVSGEGGEVPERYRTIKGGDDANSAIKQVASGRFGVTAEYLNHCREIEIKIAQGAKPGEGGQLPGFKVTEFIARMRHATPGVTLISPPPHHDIYSIEDLAQLIYDLKQINPEAKVTVKLVSAAGVGTIAAGVAKAKADTILISGHVGGTGASPLTSIKYAGAPWEMGLSEAHQVLVLNNLRDQVRLRTDGGLRTGRDIVIAAMLGAQEFGVGTVSLVAVGCLMVRQCHSNTCPVGVCTQDPELRARFKGEPDHVIRLMTFLAEDVRAHLARLGARSLDEIVGRSDLLAQVSRGSDHLDDLDLNPILARPDPRWRAKPEGPRTPVPDTLDEEIIRDTPRLWADAARREISYSVRNVQRAIGARVSSKIVRQFGPDGLEDGHLTVRLNGSAGQSLGAFGAKGLRLEVEGEANDYVGKGLSGAVISLAPARRGAAAQSHDHAIIGNTCLYGATSGALFAAGRAGERFAVRNSGAHAVVEGVSANGCEYMTGGVVVVLGPVGENFAAGMTGGDAFVYDPEARLGLVTNRESVLLSRIVDAAAEARCRDLIARHADATGSVFARRILDNWAVERDRFVQVVPKEIAARNGLTLKEVA